MTTITKVITTMPTAPSRSQTPDIFITNADATLGAMNTFVSDVNTWSGQANQVASEVNTNATTATTKANEAAASASASAQSANAPIWVSGTTYVIGDSRFSPIDFLTYRRKTAGAGTTDPSADSTNWEPLGVSPAKLNSGTLPASVTTFSASGNTIIGSATPSAWQSTIRAIEGATSGASNWAIASKGVLGGTVFYIYNAYHSGSNWILQRTAGASYITQGATIDIAIAASGTAGAVASFNTIASVSNTGLAVTGAISASTTLKSGGYLVSTLPAGTTGERAYVTDATAPTYLGALTGGGAVVCPVFKNASAWVSA